MSTESRKSIVASEMGLKQVNSYMDFITLDLYKEHRYTVKDIDYWFWSELNGMQKHHVTEWLKYEDLEKYVENGLIFIRCTEK